MKKIVGLFIVTILMVVGFAFSAAAQVGTGETTGILEALFELKNIQSVWDLFDNLEFLMIAFNTLAGYAVKYFKIKIGNTAWTMVFVGLFIAVVLIWGNGSNPVGLLISWIISDRFYALVLKPLGVTAPKKDD